MERILAGGHRTRAHSLAGRGRCLDRAPNRRPHTRLPIELSELSRLVLASVLATKVSWEDPFAIEAAIDHLRASSPWHGRLDQVMLDYGGSRLSMLAHTESAGVVAVHFAQAEEDLGVLSVSADPGVGRQEVFEAAYELARRCRNDTFDQARLSLFDLPLGEGSSWLISEHEVATREAGTRSERIEYALLPAWRLESRLDLKTSPLFGAQPALDALLGLIGSSPEGDETAAVQSAVASFTPMGFEAAAVSLLYAETGSTSRPTNRGLQHRAKLYFDHPSAAVALADRHPTSDELGSVTATCSAFLCSAPGSRHRMSQVPLLIEEAVGCPSSPIGTAGHFGTSRLPPAERN